MVCLKQCLNICWIIEIMDLLNNWNNWNNNNWNNKANPVLGFHQKRSKYFQIASSPDQLQGLLINSHFHWSQIEQSGQKCVWGGGCSQSQLLTTEIGVLKLAVQTLYSPQKCFVWPESVFKKWGHFTSNPARHFLLNYQRIRWPWTPPGYNG